MIRAVVLFLFMIFAASVYLTNSGIAITEQELRYQIAIALLTGSVLLLFERLIDAAWDFFKQQTSDATDYELLDLTRAIESLQGELRRLNRNMEDEQE